MNIVVFGLGAHYQKNKQKLKEISKASIVAFTDNNSALWNTAVDNIPVCAPQEIMQLDYDYLVVMSEDYYHEIEAQLLSYGVPQDKIMLFGRFWGFVNIGNLQEYYPVTTAGPSNKKILFITVDLNYDGGTLAIMYAALSCKEKGCLPVVLARDGDARFINEFREKGIVFWIYPNLKFASVEELHWIKGFDKIVVNTFLMAHCALELKKKFPIVWWIHEVKQVYESNKKLCELCTGDVLDSVEIYSVTRQAKENLKCFVPNAESDILLLSVPDAITEIMPEKKKKDKVIFAVVGVVSWRKAQDIFLKSAALIEQKGYENAEFWIIGNIADNKFGKEIQEQAKNMKNVKILGKKTRKEMNELYPEIDIVVVCSREETLSIVAIESMIYNKVCIVSDSCGIVDYIPTSEQHLIYQEESVEQLAEKMKWCLDNKHKLLRIGEDARKVYEKNFSMEAFSKRLQNVLKF